MSVEPSAPIEAPPRDADLSRLFVAVIAVEAFVILALYWFGRYFV
jgi:hypothetical protein